jgi:hypothetical protein
VSNKSRFLSVRRFQARAKQHKAAAKDLESRQLASRTATKQFEISMRARRVLVARDMGSMGLGGKGRRKTSARRERRENPELKLQQQIQKRQVKARVKW